MDGNYYVSHGGQIPVKWTAPEVWRDYRSFKLEFIVIVHAQALQFKKYSTASDVWSYGAVMYEMWSLGHKPFEEYSNPQVRQSHTVSCMYTVTFTMTILKYSLWSAGSSTTGNEAGRPWVPSPPSPRLSQGSVQTHDPVLVRRAQNCSGLTHQTLQGFAA